MNIEQQFFNLSFRINDMNAITNFTIHWSDFKRNRVFQQKEQITDA